MSKEFELLLPGVNSNKLEMSFSPREVETFRYEDLFIESSLFQFCAGVAINLGILKYFDLPITLQLVYGAKGCHTFVLYEILQTDQTKTSRILTLEAAKKEFEADNKIPDRVIDDWLPEKKAEKFSRESFYSLVMSYLREPASKFFHEASNTYSMQLISIINSKQNNIPFPLAELRQFILTINRHL